MRLLSVNRPILWARLTLSGKPTAALVVAAVLLGAVAAARAPEGYHLLKKYTFGGAEGATSLNNSRI
jgi:hypothetical protein